jgi:serine/threonine protein kinase
MSNPVFRNALPMQAMLHEYRIEQVLGAGGFGITYRARDTNLDKDVAIKEYLPGELAMRAPDGNVVAQGTSHEAGYKWGLDRFLQEARTLAKFSHPHIVRVLRYFEANRTAYMVMDYEQGDPLKTVLQLDPQPPEEKLKALVAPLLDGLAAVHATGFLHRDIKPDNIFIRADGRPVLIDFGAARQAMGGETKSLTSILTPGYAPLEQYSGEGRQGPWTDLYAMGGVLYRAVADRNPPDAVARIRGDDPATGVGAGLSAARGKYSEPFLRAIEWALQLDEKKRPQSVEQWKAAVLAERRVSPTVPLQTPERRTVRTVRTVRMAQVQAPARSRRYWPVMLVLALFGLAAFGMWKKQRTVAPPPIVATPAAPASRDAPEDKVKRLKQEVEREFRAADANGDGYLSADETRAHFPFITREFARVDKDGDGRISQQEFVQARRIALERRLNKQAN